ncbi:MAG: S49 family peptidase [Cyclobacteriaceae bacterium]|nr:S49 family peptidase [Cyclobacteriaceae bacterium]
MIELLSHRHWAISEAYFRMMEPKVREAIGAHVSLVQPHTEEFYENRIASLLAAAADEEVELTYTREGGFSIAKVGSKNIALIPVIGPLMKYDGLCSYGMQSYGKMIQMVNNNTNLHGAVLIMDTPGGTVDGTPELALQIAQSAKPIGVFGDGMVASAGIWLASQASLIVGNKNNYTSFGSIGTLMVTYNYSNMMEAGNYPKAKIHRARQSKEKALVNSFEEITEDVQAEIDAELESITSDFISAVKKGRGEGLDAKADGLFAGRMFDANDAKKMGLIDAVGTLQTAVNKVAALAREKDKKKDYTNNSEANNTMTKKKGFLQLIGFASDKAEATEEELIQASETKITELQAQLSAATEAKAALEARISALEAEAATQAEAVASKDAEITSLKEQLAKAPTAAVTTVVAAEEKEAAQAAEEDSGQPQKGKYRSAADDEADQYANIVNQKLPTK